jgi:CheY-like chemotaxis protein
MTRPAALIVEDQPIFGLVASDILHEVGFETFHAFDATDAAAVFDEHPEIELVVAKAELPGPQNGVELARTLSRRRPDIQLVVTSSAKGVEAPDMPRGARLLHKPYASYELRDAVGSRDLVDI